MVAWQELAVFISIPIVLILISKRPVIFSRWSHLIENLQDSSQQFDGAPEKGVMQRQTPKTHLSRMDFPEGASSLPRGST